MSGGWRQLPALPPDTTSSLVSSRLSDWNRASRILRCTSYLKISQDISSVKKLKIEVIQQGPFVGTRLQECVTISMVNSLGIGVSVQQNQCSIKCSSLKDELRSFEDDGKANPIFVEQWILQSNESDDRKGNYLRKFTYSNLLIKIITNFMEEFINTIYSHEFPSFVKLWARRPSSFRPLKCKSWPLKP